jgi:hypothetical protein
MDRKTVKMHLRSLLKETYDRGKKKELRQKLRSIEREERREERRTDVRAEMREAYQDPDFDGCAPPPPKLDDMTLSRPELAAVQRARGWVTSDDLSDPWLGSAHASMNMAPRVEPTGSAARLLRQRQQEQQARAKAHEAELAVPFNARTATVEEIERRLRLYGVNDPQLTFAPAGVMPPYGGLLPPGSLPADRRGVQPARGGAGPAAELDNAVMQAKQQGIRLDTRRLSGPAFQLYLQRRGVNPAASSMG